MICIFDNGLGYADNDTVFVEAGDLPPDVVTRIVRLRHEDAKLLGTANDVRWSNGHATPHVLDWLHPLNLVEEGEFMACARAALGPLLRTACERWLSDPGIVEHFREQLRTAMKSEGWL